MSDDEIQRAREQANAYFHGDLDGASGIAESVDKLIAEVERLREALRRAERLP